MILLNEVIQIQELLIEKYGGAKGIRDLSMLEAALNRPFMTFDQKELYVSIPDKACALICGIIQNHPFVDGNKRIGYFIFRAYLLSNQYDIQADENEKYEFVIHIADGSFKIEQTKEWLKKHIINKV